jgi:phage terminase Nu1 subunit (DNA packaging protein)
MIVDRKELSRLMGLSISRIMQLAREGVFTRVDRGRYDVAQCVDAYINFKIQGGQSGPRDVTEARKRLYDAQCHKTELENERIRRETVSAADHLESMLAFQRITDKALEGAPEGMAKYCRSDRCQCGLEPDKTGDRFNPADSGRPHCGICGNA